MNGKEGGKLNDCNWHDYINQENQTIIHHLSSSLVHMDTTRSPDFIQTPQPDSSELAAKIVSLLSVTVLSGLFGMKTFSIQFKYLSYSRWLVLTLYILSWAFTAFSMVLVTTNNGKSSIYWYRMSSNATSPLRQANFTSCLMSIMICDIFYSGTKLVIYAW